VVNEAGASPTRRSSPGRALPVNEKMKIWREEQFGPWFQLRSTTDVETPIRYVTESDFGQQVSLFGNDPAQLAKLIDLSSTKSAA